MKTQKACGVVALRDWGVWSVPSFTVIESADALTSFTTGLFGDRVFARPCPVRPRHGFVESRVCHSNLEIKAVWAEARAADPEAEMILMAPIDAVCSAVLAGGRLAIGPGNDGATSGHGAVEIQVLPIPLSGNLLHEAGLRADEEAYLEFVCSGANPAEKPYAVQLRAGPKLTAARDFIPQDVVVTAVVSPIDDLQRWEAEVPLFAPGTVVYAPGGSLASHAAIHCVLHNVPYVTTAEPAVGETLAASSDAPPFALDVDQFHRGAAWADNQLAAGWSQASGAVQLAVIVLHEWSAMRQSGPAASKLLGFACRTLARAGAAICAGEARHYSLKLRTQRDTKISRTTKITRSLTGPTAAQRRALTSAGKAFASDGWGPGFGGKNWVDCARAVDKLWRAQSVAGMTEAGLVEALNMVVNVAHNNGALLNKLVDSDFLNAAAAEPTRRLIRRLSKVLQLLTSDLPAAEALNKGGRVTRPAQPAYDRLHVHSEPSGIKAQLWKTGGQGYVSHHVQCADPMILGWVAGQNATSKSRYVGSGQMYVLIALERPIKATSEAILAAIKVAS